MRPGRVAQIGVMIVSPDGTATDPNTSINNYTPSFGTGFLANWWRSSGGRDTKMSTDIATITFDFGSDVDFTTARRNLVGALLPGNQVRHFPVSFRGAFAAGTMLVTVRR